MQIDATLKFLKSPAQLPSSGLLRTGGSGKHYENVVLYGHSTGGLVATLYGAEYGGGWRGAIDGYIFNSPFLRWNVEMYQRVLYVSHVRFQHFRCGVGVRLAAAVAAVRVCVGQRREEGALR